MAPSPSAPPLERLPPALAVELLAFARGAIAERLGLAVERRAPSAALGAPGACFVTLTRRGELRGCIGSLEARRTLLEDLRENACAAAFADPRFAPLEGHEYADLELELSLLAPLEALPWLDEEAAIRTLRPGIDGVVLTDGWHRGTFLPQVWQQLPEPRRFLAQLRRKAGLAPEHWSATLRLSRYTVAKASEGANRSAAVPATSAAEPRRSKIGVGHDL